MLCYCSRGATKLSNNLGNKETMAKNIRYYMSLYKKTRQDMCEALGVKYTTFTDWVNGNKYPRIDKIEMMANYFNITKADLVEEPVEKKSKFMIPVLGMVRAGIPMSAVEYIIDYEEISEEMARQGEFFGLKIKGDSMEPRIREGDVVIVRKQPTVESGEIAIVLVNGDEATIKKVQRFSGGINLIPSNPSYDVITFTNEQIESLPVQILGKVVELRAKF